MMKPEHFDVIIIGGSYSGLSAAMALGRAAQKVLVMDNGRPCNRPAPFSHNFLTQDGTPPAEIAASARKQVEAYPTVAFYNGVAFSGIKWDRGFEITSEDGDRFSAGKLIFATGIRDILPEIPGFAECWGISILHCPYCHGYEVRDKKTAILGNGEYVYEFAKLVSNWTKDLTLLTNGSSGLTEEQTKKIKAFGIEIIEQGIRMIVQNNGEVERVVFKDGSGISLAAIYTRLPFEQSSNIPEKLGCGMTSEGYIQVDEFQRTSVPGVFASGDNSAPFRTLSAAVAAGTLAAITANKEIIEDRFR